MLTQLINNSGISICMVGTNESTVFFEQAMQLTRRSLGLQYNRLAYDQYFHDFCSTLYRYQYVKRKAEITPVVVEWLYEHSAGIISIVVSLVHDAQEIAILNGTEELNLEMLNEAYEKQYARFLSLEQKNAALYSLQYDSCDAHHLFCILPRMGEEQYMRFCPMCVKEDRENYGETYWHRSHQVRNMRVCTKHKCRLLPSAVPAKSEQSFTFCPAEIYTDSDNVVMEDDGLTIRFAEYLKAVFDAPMDLEQDIPINAILYDGMSRTKYLKPSGRSRYTKRLADDMADFHGSMGLCDIASMYQIQRVLLGDRSDFSIVWQTAFFLGMKPEELTKSTLTAEQIKQEQSSHYMKGKVPVDWKQLDMETAPVLEKATRSIYDGTASLSGRPERVSEKLIYRELDLLGYQLENLPRCKAIFEKYAESYPENWARKVVWAYRKLE